MNTMKGLRHAGAISLALILAMLVLSAWAAGRLPPGPMATHFGLDGRANGWMGKTQALLFAPVFSAALSLFMAVLPRVMPAKGRLERSGQAYAVSWVAVVAMLGFIHAVLIAKGLGAGFDVVRPIAFGVGAVMAALGNFMPKVRYNYVFGMRTPWTLSDERVWDKTHRFAGRLMLAGGAVLMLASFVAPSSGALVVVLTICAVLPAVAGTLYSAAISPRGERT